MKIVIGCPVAERGWVLPAWFEAIEAQEFPYMPRPEIEVMVLYTASRDDTLSILQEHGATIIESMLPTRDRGRIVGHNWSQTLHEYEYMASLRNTLRKEVLQQEADYFFSLDSDILLPHRFALDQLLMDLEIHRYDAVAPLVNMLSEPGLEPAWNFMNWSDHGYAGTRAAVQEAAAFDAGIIMAAMLLNKKAQCIPWMDHRQGEDLGWSLNARRSNIKIGVIPHIVCPHRMKVHG